MPLRLFAKSLYQPDRFFGRTTGMYLRINWRLAALVLWFAAKKGRYGVGSGMRKTGKILPVRDGIS